MGLREKNQWRVRQLRTFDLPHKKNPEFQKDIATKLDLSKDIETRDGRPAPRGTLPAGKGGVPRPALWGGGGSPPRKNDQNRGEVAGQNKGPNLNFLQ